MSGERRDAGARRITSRDNTLLRELADLAHSSRARRRTRRTFLEGIHLCEAYLERHALAPGDGDAWLAVATESALAHPEVQRLVQRFRLEPVVLADPLWAALTTVENGVGVALSVRTPAPPLPARLDGDAVYLDRIQDPGNVGAILRTCAAAGVPRVVSSPGTAFCWSPKVLRAAMGAHFHLSIHESVPWGEVAPRLAVEAVGTRAADAGSIHRADLLAPRMWLFGNEGEGLSGEPAAAADRWLAIPQRPGVESLNVAAAVAVCLFEQLRQRDCS
jgi:RNA methyltransferase, TrmH family